MMHKITHLTKFTLLPLFALILIGCASTPQATESVALSPTSTPVPATDTPSDPAPADAVEPTTAVEPTEVPDVVAPAIFKLNLNTATGDEFQALIPDFSDRMVREFLEYRPYISIQQFRQEMGKYVDDAQIAEYELYVFVPVDVDESDAATLMQLPGVDEAIAAELMAARPYGSNEAFLAKLVEYVTEGDLAIATAYLAP